MKIVFTLLFLSLGLNICAQTTLNESIEVNGLNRDYILYIPAVYDGNESVPLVFNFHGFGSSAAGQMAYGDFRPIADTANFILVHPMGTEDNSGSTHWNVGWGSSTVDDVAFIDALLDQLILNYNLNEDRIYSTGMSNGGYMSYHLACFMNERIAAVASVTGSMSFFQLDLCSPPNAVPILQIHGTDDQTVPWEGVSFAIPIDTLMNLWIDHNNCNSVPSMTNLPDIDPNDGSTVDHFVYSQCDEGCTVELMRVNGGAHTWPGTFLNFPGTNYDINASIEVWKFFSRYDLNGSITNLEEINLSTFTIYPNPTSGIIYIDQNSNNLEIDVYDSYGKLLFSSFEKEIDLSNFSDGLYILSGQSEGKHFLQRVLKTQ